MNIPATGTRASVMLACAFLAALLFHQTAGGTEIPYLAGRVNDTADLLPPTTEQELEALLKSHEDSTSNQVVVLTIASLENEAIEEYSIRVVDTWKLGRKGKDNGVLLLIARDDRQVRIEVGRGLEGELTDALCAQIIRREIVPNFKSGDYDRGVRAGVNAILGAIAGSYTADADGGGDGFGDPGINVIAFLFFLAVVGLFTLIALVTPGCGGWFLYAFLLPFWGVFPYVTIGAPVGPALGLLYALGFPLVKAILPKTTWGTSFMKKLGKAFASGAGGSSGWSSRRGGSSGGWGSGSSSGSSGGGFSGGGGSFSGGGSSGSW